jgi:alpha-2-macroglobulin
MKRSVLLLSLTVLLSAQTDQEHPYFSLASAQTYVTGEKLHVEISAIDLKDLDFRVYKIDDPVKFFRQIPDPHQFGGQAPAPEREPTLIERFHHLKVQWHTRMRFVVRDQFTADAWDQIRTWRYPNENDRDSNVTQYATAPVLNQQQLVATWRQHVKAEGRWRQQSIPVEVSGKGVYLVEAVHNEQRAYTILLVSDLALITKTTRGRVVAFTADRKSGNPIPGVAIQTRDLTARTDSNGLADIPVTASKTANPNNSDQPLITARNGADFAVNTLSSYYFGRSDAELYTAYSYTDRPVYRPGHQVHFKYIVRARHGNQYDIPKLETVNVEVQGPDDKTIFRKPVPVSTLGTASGDVTIPKDAGLGFYSIQIKAGESQTQTGFEVQEYKKPEYDVRVTIPKNRVLQGEDGHATIDARYFFGEPVANAKVHYVVHRSRYWFPLFGDDGTGNEDPNFEVNGGGNQDDTGDAGDELSDQEGTLDANGQLNITFPTTFKAEAHGDARYRVEARVTDAGNREIIGYASLIATYGTFLINVEPSEYVISPGSPSAFKLTAVDYDNKPIQTKIDLRLYAGYSQKEAAFISQAQGETGSDGHGTASLTIPKGGVYFVRASAVTPENRKVESIAYVWASGTGPSIYPGRETQLQVIADKKSYQPGDTAKILIMTGVPNAKVLFSREGRALGEVKVIESAGTSLTVELPIREEDEPDFFVSALFLKDNKLHQGFKRIVVPPKDKKLSVNVITSKAQYRPGETGQFTVEAKDSNGKPVSGEFSVGVVDEAVYGVRPDTTENIVNAFYGSGYNTIDTENSMVYYFHGEAGIRRMMLAELHANRRALAQLKPDRFVQPKVRKEFPDTALWLPAVKTGADGKGIVNVSFPDSVTTWRTTTRGITADSKVGSSVTKTIVRKNVILRMVTPRFFTQNDEVVISAVIHNYLINDKHSRVSLDVKGLDIIDGGTRDVILPSRGEVKVDWRVRASSLGDALITGKVLTDEESDAVELTLPVEPQGVKITRSRSGSQSGTLNVAFPKAVVPLSRELEISVSPSIAGALFGAIDYLTEFPYGCTEQTLSSFVPNIVVSKALSDLNIKSDVNQQLLNRKIRAGLDRLYDFQHEDGGWGWWKTDDSGIFMTTAVVAGLSQAKAAGVELKPEALDNAVKWLKTAYAKEPRTLADLKAYSVYALSLAGDNSLIEDGWSQRSNMSSYGQAMLGLALEAVKDRRSAQIADTIESAAKSSDSEAWWPNDRDTLMDFYADTSSESTAFALKLLVHEHPQSPLLPKAAVYLMNHRSEGFYWYSTKQTAMVIYGLTDYLKSTGELKPNLNATVTVNGKPVLTKAFQPADALAIQDTRISLPGMDSNDIKIDSSGEGRLYWSVKQTYYSTDQKAFKMGNASLNILRDYYKLTPGKDGEKIVYSLDPLQGSLNIGDILAVRLTVTGSNWKYLLIEDPIPAGAEFIERDDLYQLKARPDWWTTYFDRREFHDDRAAIFQTYFNAGQRQYYYLLKIVNPGVFKVSPARVEPMYQPDLLSTTENKEVTVK